MFDPEKFITESIEKIKADVKGKAIIACSGGVDSTVAAVLGAGRRGDGCWLGNGVTATWCIGHLLETAPPYLTPHPHRGRRNEPAYLPLISDRLTELYGATPSAIARASTSLALRFFGLEDAYSVEDPFAQGATTP
jgi:hypothetical protein